MTAPLNLFRERPILFSGPMVRAILDGRKTQTRRVLKPQPPVGVSRLIGPEIYRPVAVDRHGDECEGEPIFGVYDDDGEFGTAVPFQPGDRLWVREAAHYGPNRVAYCADNERLGPSERVPGFGPAKPSIHMPRWASRITLEVTAVRVERLQDMLEVDAIDEGALTIDLPAVGPATQAGKPPLGASPLVRFRHLWDEINGKRPGCAWANNPWVIAVTFKRHTP
ncbi:hypothetical protein [Phreatobacter oligotrophus]|uniref:Uncharacterized protein n=1 Tax=Phreatobacter oligotrophus TaxID=1122261 RepID=A0A2T4ZIQ6_9HYPH|nr:hypothetical protein [Phreatobacter oligotrophus]PTM61866.1 hypothetical protein C8P69_101538 [Phreatobacter oligotrophus]